MKELIKKYLPKGVLTLYYKIVAMLGCVVYGFPSRDLIVIGVTGTNGKTTTCHCITAILEAHNVTVGMTTTIDFKIGKNEWVNETKQGMPGRWGLQKLLRQMVDAGCSYAVIESTSEGLAQYRHWGIEYSVGVCTNLTPEHIESHGSFEAYKQAKGKLFQYIKPKKKHTFASIAPTAVINLDSPHSDFFASLGAEYSIGYGIKGRSRFLDIEKIDQVVEAHDVNTDAEGVSCFIEDTAVRLNLIGEMNVYNALAAWAVCEVFDIPVAERVLGLQGMQKVAGRMEKIEKDGITVIVDYAHDPVALESVYNSLSDIKEQDARLIAVFGATGGGRDKAKREQMGRIAAHFCDYIILTNDDPYDEPPLEIMQEIEKGLIAKGRVKEKEYVMIENRKDAIQRAIGMARAGDIVILTGKGAETVMVLAQGKKVPWSDKKIVEDILWKSSVLN